MRIALAALFLCPLLLTSQAESRLSKSSPEDLPLWEAGVGLGAALFPDYPGSDEESALVVPFPTFLYRGLFFRSDEEGGVRGRFFRGSSYEVSLSFGGSLPVKSSENQARSGMPDLNLLGEYGPSLLLKLKKYSAKSKNKLFLNLPLRLANSIDFPDVKEQGVIFNPFLYYTHEDLLIDDTILLIGVDLRFATRKYHDFYYTVEDQFATPERAAFRAKAGYGGAGVLVAMSYLFRSNISVFSAVYHSRFENTAVIESPLVRTTFNTSVFLGLVWWGWKSETSAKQ